MLWNTRVVEGVLVQVVGKPQRRVARGRHQHSGDPVAADLDAGLVVELEFALALERL